MIEWLLLIAAALIAAWVGVDLARGRDHQVHRHLQRLGANQPTLAEGPAAPRRGLERRLRAAGLRLRPGTFVAGSLLAASLCALALLTHFPSLPWVAAISASFALYIPHAMVRAWAGRRARRFETKLVDALDFLVGALESGQNATQALASAAETAEQPIRTAFGEIARRIEMGMSPARAVAPTAEAYDAEGTRIFTQTLVARIKAGGALAPVLRSVNRIIRARLEMRLRLRSQLSGAQSAAIFIAMIPYVLIPIYAWRKPDWIDRLTTHPAGPQMLFFAVVLQVIGFLWIRRILRVGVG